MNWFIQHATQDSYKIIQERTTRKINKSVELNIVPRDRKDSTSSVKGAQHEQSVMSAVEKGIVLKGLKPISSDEFPESSISFPQTKYSLSQEMSDACVIKTIFIPDPDCLHEYQTQAYQPKWDFLFQHCLHKEALYSISSRMKTIKELDTDTAYVSGKHRPKSSDEMTVITSHLIPNDARNAGFDSILLMFRCKKDPFDLHSLGVLFLQDTTGATHGISPGGVVLMKKWCYILETRYRLKRVQIFPSYIVVANGNNYKSFTLINKKNLGQFIPEQNIWIAKFEAHGEIEVGYDTIPPMTASASPILDRALDEEVNKNPHAVRCAYCRSLVTENFPDHFCGGMSEKTIRVKVNEKLIGVLEHSKNPDIQPTEEPVHIENLAEDISDNLVTDPSDIKPRKPSSKLPSTIQSPPHRKEYVEITYTNGIPGNPDVYRMPFLPPPSTMITQSAQSLSRSIDAPHQPNDVRPDASSQPLPDRLNDPSRIREAHLLWVEGYILSYQELGTYRFKPIKLAKQPFHSLRFDEPGTDVTDITHNAQYMLPSVTNDRFTPLDFITETGTAFISSKRVEYEYFWQWLNRKNPLTGMVVALQADEIELTKRIQKCEDENEKSRLTCLIAKVLLLRSRLYIQSGALTTAQWFFERSKQHMVLNDTAEVEYELILARSNGREISPRGSDELNRIIVNARNCFGINWEQWIQEGQNLPILLNPSYHRLQYHLKQVQDHVNTLRSRLKSIVDPGPMTNDPRRATMEEALPQTLKEGLTLQLLIAWKTGYRDQLEFFQNELNSTFQNEGDKTIKAMTTPFKSQKRQIERLDIAVVTKAINDILTTTQNHFNTLHVLESTNGVEMMIGDHSSISITPSIHRSIQQDIHTTTQLLIDRISAIKTASCQKLKHTGNTVMTNALEQMAEELNPILITTSNHDADMEAVEDTSSNVMLTEESEEEPSLPEEPRAKFNENSFGKGKRANKTVSTQYDTTQTIYHCSYFESQEDDKESNDIKYFRKHLGAANVVNTNGDGNCWLYAIYDQLTYDELVSAGFLLLTHDKCSNDAMCYFKSQVRSRMVHTMRGNMDGVVTFLTGLNSETPEDYIDRQLKDGQWGGDAELSTVCRVIQRQIAVYYPNDNPVFVYAPDPTLPTVDIGHCGGNHFVSLHSVPIINKTGFKKLHTKVQTLTKPKVIVNKLKRSQPTTPEKEPPTAETDDNQTRTPKRPKKKDDQSEKSSIPSMPLFNVIP
ncbi:hypothetical protein BLNAU_14295 [Blattamonas nauphoetae]|uniref:OTU domain-containing protein n=1 Tax=Blattamonas nauphoetae TaxID=2049346 RepID=A0ABQ9XE69_9EUKA|nr:hypothetical protein BLNAU_14295 [Blattamonas nauphoetae]